MRRKNLTRTKHHLLSCLFGSPSTLLMDARVLDLSSWFSSALASFHLSPFPFWMMSSLSCLRSRRTHSLFLAFRLRESSRSFEEDSFVEDCSLFVILCCIISASPSLLASVNFLHCTCSRILLENDDGLKGVMFNEEDGLTMD